jgi:transposase
MGEVFWLTEAQVTRLRPFFPKSRGRARVDDRRVLSGIIYVNRNGLMWKDAPAAYGPPKTLYNRWKRWGRMGVFARMMTELAARSQDTDTLMIDIEPVVRHRSEDRWRGHLKAHRTASSLRAKKGGQGRSAAASSEEPRVG